MFDFLTLASPSIIGTVLPFIFENGDYEYSKLFRFIFSYYDYTNIPVNKPNGFFKELDYNFRLGNGEQASLETYNSYYSRYPADRRKHYPFEFYFEVIQIEHMLDSIQARNSRFKLTDCFISSRNGYDTDLRFGTGGVYTYDPTLVNAILNSVYPLNEINSIVEESHDACSLLEKIYYYDHANDCLQLSLAGKLIKKFGTNKKLMEKCTELHHRASPVSMAFKPIFAKQICTKINIQLGNRITELFEEKVHPKTFLKGMKFLSTNPDTETIAFFSKSLRPKASDFQKKTYNFASKFIIKSACRAKLENIFDKF